MGIVGTEIIKKVGRRQDLNRDYEYISSQKISPSKSILILKKRRQTKLCKNASLAIKLSSAFLFITHKRIISK